MLKRADAKYFGFKDDEDEDFLKKERKAEMELREEAMENWKAMQLLKAADMGVDVDKVTGEALIDGKRKGPIGRPPPPPPPPQKQRRLIEQVRT